MWVKGSPLKFLVDSGSQKNLISVEVVKWLGLPTIAHPHLYTIRWLHPRRDIRIRQQCRLPYSIKPFMDEVLCDVAPLDVANVLLGQPYLWRRHAVYESRPCSVIITLGNNLYRIPEVVPPPVISLTTAKQRGKIVSQMRKFIFLTTRSQGKNNIVATTSKQGSPTRLQQMEKIMEEYEDIFSSLTEVPLHCQDKYSIDMTPNTLPPDVTIPPANTHTESTHVLSEADKETKFTKCI